MSLPQPLTHWLYRTVITEPHTGLIVTVIVTTTSELAYLRVGMATGCCVELLTAAQVGQTFLSGPHSVPLKFILLPGVDALVTGVSWVTGTSLATGIGIGAETGGLR